MWFFIEFIFVFSCFAVSNETFYTGPSSVITDDIDIAKTIDRLATNDMDSALALVEACVKAEKCMIAKENQEVTLFGRAAPDCSNNLIAIKRKGKEAVSKFLYTFKNGLKRCIKCPIIGEETK